MKKIVFNLIERSFFVLFLFVVMQLGCFASADLPPVRSSYACLYATDGEGAEKKFYALVATKNVFWKGNGISSNPGQFVFPGGGLEGADPKTRAALEFREETGSDLPNSLSMLKEFPYTSEERYAALYVKMGKGALDALSDAINSDTISLAEEPRELADVSVIPLEMCRERVPTKEFKDFCRRNHEVLFKRKKIAEWRSVPEKFFAALRMQPTEESGEPGLGLKCFADQNYTGMFPYISGFINGEYRASRGLDTYAIVRGKTEFLPSKFCTDWFFEIARCIPEVDEELEKREEGEAAAVVPDMSAKVGGTSGGSGGGSSK